MPGRTHERGDRTGQKPAPGGGGRDTVVGKRVGGVRHRRKQTDGGGGFGVHESAGSKRIRCQRSSRISSRRAEHARKLRVCAYPIGLKPVRARLNFSQRPRLPRSPTLRRLLSQQTRLRPGGLGMALLFNFGGHWGFTGLRFAHCPVSKKIGGGISAIASACPGAISLVVCSTLAICLKTSTSA